MAGGLALALLTNGVALAQLRPFGPPVPPVSADSAGRWPVSWTANLDFRDSFINRRHVNVWGVNTGLIFGPKRQQVTVGYYWLSYNTYLRLINWRRDRALRLNIDYYTRIDMAFGSLMYWWNLRNNQRWTLSVPLEIGAGVASAIPADPRTDVAVGTTRRDFFMPVQVGLYGEWKAYRWVGFSAQVGYRHSVFQTNLKEHYDGTYYSVGLTLYPALVTDVWAALFGKRKP